MRLHFTASSDGNTDILSIATVIKSAGPALSYECADREEELQGYISALEQSSADITALKNVALLCTQMPVLDSSTPASPEFSAPLTPSPVASSSSSSPAKRLWSQNKNIDRLFTALIKYLSPDQVSPSNTPEAPFADLGTCFRTRIGCSTVSLYCGK